MDFSFLGPVEPQLVVQALHDERVQRALARSLFDIRFIIDPKMHVLREIRGNRMWRWLCVRFIFFKKGC